MTEELYDDLMNMYDSFLKESEEVKKKLDNNLEKISEIDGYMERLSEKEESDFKVFSPRSVKTVYKDDIESRIERKKEIENENQNYYKLINRLDSRIHTTASVLHMIEKGRNESGAGDSGNPEPFSSVHGNSPYDHDNREDKLRILDIQERERQRIARDLHDSSLQNLAHLTHKIELAALYIDQDPIKAKLELAAVNKDLKTVIQEIRNTIFDLRPMSFDDLGLKESLERLVDKLKESSEFEFQTEIESIECDNSMVLMTIFRIAEESMNNAIKHSSGTKIIFILKKVDDKCSMVIKDNGQGFKSEDVLSDKDRHFGLCILKERVSLLSGNVDIDSKLGNGTTVSISIPI